MKCNCRRVGVLVVLATLTLLRPAGVETAQQSESSTRVNQVLEWNQIFIDTLIATSTANSSSQRLGAIVHTAIFDAYNGIDRRYTPIFVRTPEPERNAAYLPAPAPRSFEPNASTVASAVVPMS